MADKGLDFSGWKKTKEGKDSTEFKHADGHTMQVAHKSLTPALQKQLKSLPAHMESGGNVAEELPPVDNDPTYNQQITPTPSGLLGNGLGAPAPSAPAALSPRPTPAVPSTPPKDPATAGMEAGSNAAITGLGEQKAANTGIAKVEGEIASKTAPEMEKGAKQQQQFADTLDQNRQKYDQIVQDASKAINAGEIKPQHIFEGKDLPNRIGTAISLLLGGMGGGLLHQENPVLKQMNQEIQQDIQRQQLNQNNRLNLMGAISNQLGHSAGAAQIATGIIDNHLKNMVIAQAMKLGSPLAMQRAQLINGQLESGAAPLRERAAFLAAQQAHGAGGSPEESLMQYYGMQDPKAAANLAIRLGTTHGISKDMLSYAGDAQKNFVQGPGDKYYNAGSPEAAKEYNDDMSKYQPLMKDLQSLQQFNTLGAKLKVGPAAEAANAAAGRIEQQLLALGSSGRLSETALGFSKGLFSDPTKLRSLVSNNAGTDQLIKSLGNHIQFMQKQRLPGLKQPSSFKARK